MSAVIRDSETAVRFGSASRIASLVWLACLVVIPLGDTRAGDTSLPARFQHHIDYLASDELGGRGVGSEGIE
ncbi:MAG: hypothetical protein ACPGXK_14940, partial [Phycisphaerae bacterium]